MGFEPPPNVLNPGQIRGKIRTGAKTATKDQEREYLDRFRRLAEDPSPLVPQWVGSGPDPFARLRRRLKRVSTKRDRSGWLKWLSRGRSLSHAYAATLLVLQGGKIPSFASIKFRGRDVKFVLRGHGLREKLIAVQNHEDADVRLLGYLDWARKRKGILVSVEEEFVALSLGQALPPRLLVRLLGSARLEVRERNDGAECVHLESTTPGVAFTLKEAPAFIRLCRACLARLDDSLLPLLEAHLLVPGVAPRLERRVLGIPYGVHPASERPALDALLDSASQDAVARAQGFENVSDATLIEWRDLALEKRLSERREGFLLVDRDLWLADFVPAARAYATTDLERRALEAAFHLQTPRLRVHDASTARLLEPAWSLHAKEIVAELSEDWVSETDQTALARQRPGDALVELERLLRVERAFAAYPRYRELGPRLHLAYELTKTHKTGDRVRFQRTLGDGVANPLAKPLALALARAAGQNAGIEWQFSPHEKDQVQFLEPFARRLVLADPQDYGDALAALADAVGEPRPVLTVKPSPTP